MAEEKELRIEVLIARRPDVKAAAMQGIKEFQEGRGKPWPQVKRELGL